MSTLQKYFLTYTQLHDKFLEKYRETKWNKGIFHIAMRKMSEVKISVLHMYKHEQMGIEST